MKISLRKNRVLIRAMREEKTKTGLYIPQSSTDKRGWCEIVEVGPEVTDLKSGDIVIRDIACPVQIIDYNGENAIILVEDGIVGIIEK